MNAYDGGNIVGTVSIVSMPSIARGNPPKTPLTIPGLPTVSDRQYGVRTVSHPPPADDCPSVLSVADGWLSATVSRKHPAGTGQTTRADDADGVAAAFAGGVRVEQSDTPLTTFPVAPSRGVPAQHRPSMLRRRSLP